MSSNFENLPLPVTKDSQDYVRLIPAGQTVEIPVVGDFIYCKFSDGEIRVVINGKSTSMESGDERRSGDGTVFRGVNLINDTVVDKSVIFVIGFGGFNRRIVRGEITAELKLRTSDGSYIDDTRFSTGLDVLSVAGTGITENCGEIVKRIDATWSYSVDGGSRTVNSNNTIIVDYNPAVHDGLIVLTRTSDNRYWAIEIEPLTGALIRDLGQISDLGQPAAVTRFGDTLYQKNTYNSEGIYKKPIGSESWERIVSFSSNDPNISVDDDGNIYTTNNDKVYKFSPAGEGLGNVDVGNSLKTLGWHQNQIWAFPSANYRAKFYTKDLEYIGKTSCTMAGSEGRAMFGPYSITYKEGSTDIDRIKLEATKTVVDLLAGQAFPRCQNRWLNKPPSAFEGVRTTADINVTNAESGVPTVTGELIKLIFEFYTGSEAPADYMDYIFGINIVGQRSLSGANFPPITVVSEGQTFLAAGVVDYFASVMPYSVQITFDKRIRGFL
jgi:hypothetical protein